MTVNYKSTNNPMGRLNGKLILTGLLIFVGVLALSLVPRLDIMEGAEMKLDGVKMLEDRLAALEASESEVQEKYKQLLQKIETMEMLTEDRSSTPFQESTSPRSNPPISSNQNLNTKALFANPEGPEVKIGPIVGDGNVLHAQPVTPGSREGDYSPFDAAASKAELVNFAEKMKDLNWVKNLKWPKCTLAQSISAGGIVTTSLSANHFKELKGGLSRLIPLLPDNWEVVVTDLGLEPSQAEVIRSWCKVTLVPFDWGWLGFAPGTSMTEINKAILGLTNSVWKPFEVLYSVLYMLSVGRGCGYVIHSDSAFHFQPKFFSPEPVPHRAYQNGILFLRDRYYNVAAVSHPKSLELLSEITDGMTFRDSKYYHTVPVVRGGFHIWNPSHNGARHRVLFPFLECAKNHTCMAPRGATGFTHNPFGGGSSCKPSTSGSCFRGDQFVLSILAAHYMNHGDWNPLSTTGLSASYMIKRKGLPGTYYMACCTESGSNYNEYLQLKRNDGSTPTPLKVCNKS